LAEVLPGALATGSYRKEEEEEFHNIGLRKYKK
jgi:hypothetical protein